MYFNDVVFVIPEVDQDFKWVSRLDESGIKTIKVL